MDPLSISASIAGLISAADVVVTRLYKYIKGVKDAEKDVSALATEVTGLYGVLNSLRLVAIRIEGERFEPTLRVHHIHACYDTLDSLRTLLDKNDPTLTSSRMEATMKRLQWPLSARRTKDFIEEVGRHKQTLSLATSAQTLSALLESLTHQQNLIDGVNDIRKRMEATSLTKTRQHVLDWLSQADPTTAQASILALRQFGTGIWICDDTKFKNWMEGKQLRSSGVNSVNAGEDLGLWIVGIPGAGKTVLTATIVEEVTQRKIREGTAVAFFFCDFKSPLANTSRIILGSLVRQIACQNTPSYESAKHIYDEQARSDGLTSSASIDELRDCLAKMIRELDHLYIIIDGLDECGDESMSIIQELRDLAPVDEDHAVHLLFVSRDEYDIRIALAGFESLSIVANSHDLRLYVDAEIASRTAKKRLRIRDPALKEEIRERLISKADGMFRWVVCQINAICALNSDKLRRKALETMPPDLPTTYERILEKVNASTEHNQMIVWRALRWILFSVRPVPLAALSEAIGVEKGDTFLDRDAFIDEEAILEGCGSLVRREADTLELAHFTVREFLEAINEIYHSNYLKYRADVFNDGLYLAEICLTHMCLGNFVVDGSKRTREQFIGQKASHPFRRYAIRYWDIHARKYQNEKSIALLLQRLFDPSPQGHFFSFINDLVCILENEGLIRDSLDLNYDLSGFDCEAGKPPFVKICFEGPVPERSLLSRLVNVGPLHWAASLALSSLCQWLIEQACDVNQVDEFMSSPLDCAVAGRRLFGHYLKDSDYGTADLRQYRMSTVQSIVAAGGDVNHRQRLDYKEDRAPELILCHAMYAAEEGRNWEVVRFLLTAGSLCDRACIDYLRTAPEKDTQAWEILRNLTEDNILRDDVDYFREALANLNMGWERLDDPARIPTSSLESKFLLFNATMYGQLGAIRKLALTKEMLNENEEAGGTALHIAVEHDHPEIVDYLCTAGIKIDHADSSGKTALMVAVMREKPHCVSALLQHGADTRAVEESGLTAIHYAGSLQSTTLFEMVLLSPNSNGPSLYHTDNRGETPLLRAAALGSLKVVQYIIEHVQEADVHHRRDDGEGCLHQAAWSGDVKKIAFFLNQGLHVNERNNSGGTPLFNAIHKGPHKSISETIKLLHSHGADIDASDSSGSVPLFRLIEEFGESGDQDMLDAFNYLLYKTSNIHQVDDEGYNALHVMCALCPNVTSTCIHIICQTLIGRGCSLTARSKDGHTPIHILMNRYLTFENEDTSHVSRDEGLEMEIASDGRNPFGQLICCILKDTLVEKSVLSGVHFHGISLLSMSIERQDDDLVNAVLQHDSEVDRKDENPTPGHRECMTPLEWACMAPCLRKETFKRIVSYSRALDIVGYEGKFPIHLASMRADEWGWYMAEVLLESGVDPNRESVDHRTPLMIACSRDSHNLMEALYSKGARVIINEHRNGLANVCAKGHTEVLSWLLSKPEIDVDINATFHYTDKTEIAEMTLLHQAVFEGRTEMITLLLNKGIKYGVNSTVTITGTNTKLTPLYMAATEGDLDTVSLLLDQGADPSLIGGPNKQTPLHSATMYNFPDVLETLLAAGADLNAEAENGVTPYSLALTSANKESVGVIQRFLDKQNTPSDASALMVRPEIIARKPTFEDDL